MCVYDKYQNLSIIILRGEFMRPRRIASKLRDELIELKNSRGAIDQLFLNYLNNFSENAKLTHFLLNSSFPIKSVAHRQYFVFLVSSLETFFRDLFVYIHSIDDEMMNELLKNFKKTNDCYTLEDFSLIEILSKSFNFQNVNDVEVAFGQLWDNGFLDTICNSSINPCGFNGKVFQNLCINNMIPNWKSIFNEVFTTRHKVIHDANFRPNNNIKTIQTAEALFALIPQFTTFLIAKKYKLPSMFLENEDGICPYIFSIQDILVEDWHIVE